MPSVTAKDIEKKLEESENRRKSLEVRQDLILTKIFLQNCQAATLERLAEMERRAEEVRAKKASMPPGQDIDTVLETE